MENIMPEMESWPDGRVWIHNLAVDLSTDQLQWTEPGLGDAFVELSPEQARHLHDWLGLHLAKLDPPSAAADRSSCTLRS